MKRLLLKYGSRLGTRLKILRVVLKWVFNSEDSLIYTSIENLPTAKWWKINETHDYTLLLKDKNSHITQSVYDKCSNIWDEIHQQHIDKFGHPKAFLDYWGDLSRLYSKKIKAAINGGTDETHYEIAQVYFDQRYKSVKSNNHKMKGNIERVLNLGYRIDPETMPIIEFSSLIELANETVKNG